MVLSRVMEGVGLWGLNIHLERHENVMGFVYVGMKVIVDRVTMLVEGNRSKRPRKQEKLLLFWTVAKSTQLTQGLPAHLFPVYRA